jgi:hypothetical protein
MANIAIIGFEFSHMPTAFEMAFERLGHEKKLLTPVIWSATDGLKQEVVGRFPSCVFLDANRGWHGEYRMSMSESDHIISPLTELEKKHFSYTHSRITYLRDPGRITKDDIIFYEDILRFCFALIKREKVSLFYFADFPHNLTDLGMLYAARRLGICSLVNDGPYIGDYNFPLLLPYANLPVGSYPMDSELFTALNDELLSRDLNQNLEPPNYISKPNENLPKVPLPTKLFCHKNIVENIYKHASPSLAAVLNKFIYWSIKMTASSYLSFIKIFFSKKLDGRCREPFVLVLLQFHPERTTSPMALDTPFEEERVILLARRFPDKLIVVREHPENLKNPSLLQYRSLRVLKKMNGYSNVRYVLPGGRDSYRELIKSSLFTVSTSGTVALESIQLGVPSVHMSNSFAYGFPGVIIAEKVDEIELCKVYELRGMLQRSTKEELITVFAEALSQRPMNQGFVRGYHTNIYTNEELVNSAAIIVYSSILYAARMVPELFA